MSEISWQNRSYQMQQKVMRMNELMYHVFERTKDGKELLELMTEIFCIEKIGAVENMPDWHVYITEGERGLIRKIRHTIKDVKHKLEQEENDKRNSKQSNANKRVSTI
jgi:hypothetical protein